MSSVVVKEIISQDGTPIAVWQSGAGPPLVLVHGAAADHNRWAPVLPALEARFTALAIDRRGRGQSGDVDDYAIEREYEDVAAVVESAGDTERSLGTPMAASARSSRPCSPTRSQSRSVRAADGILRVAARCRQSTSAVLKEDRRDELVTFFMSEVAGLPADQVELLRSLPAWEARLAVAHTIPREERANREYDFDPDRFQGLDVPTLFLQGGDSPAPFKKAAEAVREMLRLCCGHARPATCRDGYRHRAVYRGGAGLSRR